MMVMEKTLQEPMIIFCPKSVTFCDDPNWMNIEIMFHKLSWKLLQFFFGKVKKYVNANSSIQTTMMSHKRFSNGDKNWNMHEEREVVILSQTGPRHVHATATHIQIQENARFYMNLLTRASKLDPWMYGRTNGRMDKTCHRVASLRLKIRREVLYIYIGLQIL